VRARWRERGGRPGPPGTGKTHTTANIIAHYMATGRRVLVSAHEPEALAAILQKLPEASGI
jgi:Holliday junction resolvasome RuvABC ATP-dependent DNA helicase subunit